jgi:hypothetical protein
MKNLIKIGLLAGLLSLAGCDDDLSTEQTGLVTQGGLLTNEVLENSVRSSYDLLSNRLNILAQWDWPGGLVFQNDYVMQDIASDDMEKKWNPDGDQPWIDEINNYTFTASNGGPNGLWKYDYEGINRINLVMELLLTDDVETVSGITEARKNQLLGELYFLRSYYYFSLVTNFGDVPLLLRPVKSLDEAFIVAVRANKDLVWEQIKTDLTFFLIQSTLQIQKSGAFLKGL